MMLRRIHNKDPAIAPPLLEVMWDKSGLMIAAKAGTIEIGEIGALFKQVLIEIQDTINKGKANATNSK